ncbi:GFA family protein [Kiloniella laminariae]|uniref:GFA family protein n=1 Tax=Kiloniella laminariae TaxID=454162 RepID=UPI00035C2E41|nr:GFA family protein [Kiloniella laminariae]
MTQQEKPKVAKMTGKCLCGAVKFTASEVTTGHGACHCSTCRKWGGGPALATDVGSIQFEGQDNISVYGSSDWAERGFCKTCGTHLFYRLKEGGMNVVWVGAFDQQEAFTLAAEIYIDRKPKSYDFAGDHPRLTEAEFLKSIGMGE